MSNAVQQVIIELPAVQATDGPATRHAVQDVIDVARIAARGGATALLLPRGEAPTVDPTILAGYLTAAEIGIPVIVEAQTGRDAPYNLARRIQTLARLTHGGAGVYLRSTGVDPVTTSSGVTADAVTADEYVEVLRRLWASFPQDALIGDRNAGLLADVRSIAPAAYRGEVYAVAGALNVPLTPEYEAAILVDRGALADAKGADALVDPSGDDPVALRRFIWRPQAGGEAEVLSGTAEETVGVLAAAGARGIILRIEDDEPAATAAAFFDAAAEADLLPPREHSPLRRILRAAEAQELSA